MPTCEAVQPKAPYKLEILLQTVFACVDEKIVTFLCCNTGRNTVSLLIKLFNCQFHLSCEFSIVNRSSKFSGKLVSALC